MDPKVYIIVLNYNGWEDTIECLESLLKLKYDNYQIVVVDNASVNNSVNHIKAWLDGKICIQVSKSNPLRPYSFPPSEKPLPYIHYQGNKLTASRASERGSKIVLIESPNNNGYSAGNNLGIEYGLSQKDADYFWILNNDTVLPPDSLSALVVASEEAGKSGKKTGIWGGKLLYYHNPSLIQNVGAFYYPLFAYSKIIGGNHRDSPAWDTPDVRINHVVGASLFVPQQFIAEVGSLSEDYFLYLEEIDWAVRARRCGWDIGYCSQARIFHKEGMSINNGEVFAITGTKSRMADYYWTRNKILITRKFYPLFLPLVIPATLISILMRLIRKQPERMGLLLRAIFHGFTEKKLTPGQLQD